MIRGTTAQFQFKLPYNKNNVSVAEVTFWQPGNQNGLKEDFPLPIIKGYTKQISADGSIVTSGPWNWLDDYTLSVRLDQQETATFSDKYKARYQLRASTVDGLVFGSNEELVTVYPVFRDIPIGDVIMPNPADDGYIVLDGDDILE